MQGARPFRLAEKVAECDGVASLHLAPEDGAPLAPYAPGQYLTLAVPVPGAADPVVRCYSLSEAPRPERYRVTVRALPGARGAPPGRASTWLVREAAPGLRLEVGAPAGRFTLDTAEADPVVLVGAGIGVTPLLAMLDAQVQADPSREVRLFLGFRSGAEHPFRTDLRAIAAAHPAVHLVTCYSRPGPDDVRGRDYDLEGWITIHLLKRHLPPSDRPYRFFVCGPPPMMGSVVGGLEDLGVPGSRVHIESFGPATVKKLRRVTERRLPKVAAAAAAEGPRVTFAKSGVDAAFEPRDEALLYLAERAGVPIPYACASGHCGTCLTPLREGEVEYPVAPQFPLREGQCLPCIARPRGDVVLDA